MWCPPTPILFLPSLNFIKSNVVTLNTNLVPVFHKSSSTSVTLSQDGLILNDCHWHNANKCWVNNFSFSSALSSGLPIRMWPTSVTPLGPESIVNIPDGGWKSTQNFENDHKWSRMRRSWEVDWESNYIQNEIKHPKVFALSLPLQWLVEDCINWKFWKWRLESKMNLAAGELWNGSEHSINVKFQRKSAYIDGKLREY